MHETIWFRYIRRWVPISVNQKAAWGRVLHATSCDLYNKTLPQDLAFIYDNYCKEEGLQDVDLINRGYKLLEIWVKDVLPNDNGLRPILMDRLAGVKVNGWEYLFRPDRVLYSPILNRYILHEVKSTGYSLNVVAGNLKKTHQVTGYIWGFNRKFQGADVCEVQPEIWYTRQGVYQVRRTAPIYRSPQELVRFGSDLRYWIDELLRKYEDPSEHVFPRSFHCTEGSNFRCDYDVICGQKHEGCAVPVGFKVKEDMIR